MPDRVHTNISGLEWVPDLLFFLSIEYGHRGLTVLTLDAENDSEIRVMFKDSVIAFRVMDESRYANTRWVSSRSSPPKSPIVSVTDSDFLQWFKREAEEVFNVESVIHVAILTQDEWIDVICLREPSVRRDVERIATQ